MSARHMLSIVVSACSVGLTLGFAASSEAGELPVCRVDVLGPDLQGFDMNEHGDVCGRKVLSGNLGVAFVARMGEAPQVLPFPSDWLGSDAYAISNTGVIVGAVSTVGVASIGSHAAAWFPSGDGYEFVLLGALPGHDYSTALGVNDLGDIVGGSGGIGLGLYSASVRFGDGGPTALPGISLAVDVNNARQVLAGNSLLDLETMEIETIPLPPGNWQGMSATDLNEVGGFCGWVIGFSGCSTFPLRYMPATGWEFVGGCATTTAATSINDHGDVLAYVYTGGIWANLVGFGTVDISSLIDPSEGAWLVTGVSTINNARQMLVGAKLLPNGASQLIRLTPIVFADLDGDGAVDGADLGLLLAEWGRCDGCAADLDASGAVDGGDLGLLLGAWFGDE